MQGLCTGNAREIEPGRRGWFVGYFIGGGSPRHSDELEVQWAEHPKGKTNGGFAKNKTARTLSVLISGKFRLTFRQGESTEEVVLQKPGDFALWEPGVGHDWVAEADTVMMTVRWPSVAGDQD
jgi:hypothetical protein